MWLSFLVWHLLISYLHSPPKLPYYLHLFITSTPLFYKRNKKSHLIILLSQSSCHAPSNSLGLGPLLGLDPLMGLGPLLGLGFKGLSILYLVSINFRKWSKNIIPETILLVFTISYSPRQFIYVVHVYALSLVYGDLDGPPSGSLLQKDLTSDSAIGVTLFPSTCD